MFGHRAPIILFERIAGKLWQLDPKILADQVFAVPIEQFFRSPINEGKFPIPVDCEESVIRFFQDVGHFSDCFLQFRPRLVAFSQRTNAPLSYREPDIQSRRVKRFDQIIVGPGFQRPFQVLRVVTRRDQKNE